MNVHQRKGSVSNSHVGREFEEKVKNYFSKNYKINLTASAAVLIGINGKKEHFFDLVGNQNGKLPILIECKAHRWTKGKNVPSAKLTVWNEAMYFFSLAAGYRKLFVVTKDHRNSGESLAAYYIRINKHLIPKDVEIWEYDEANDTCEQLYL